eukprot:683290-Pleurochrysis_carterae.AAC.1
MRHATREGNRSSFWTYLKVNGYRGCRRQEEEETIHHVLSGGCQGIGRNRNIIYRTQMKTALVKCGKLMSDINNTEGIEQATKALCALERPRQQTDIRLKEDEELALKQMISGSIPEWRETDNKREKGFITLLRSWTGEMMNLARIQMKTWLTKKNEHKTSIQQRWDNREKYTKPFRDGGKGWDTNMMHRRKEKRIGKRE